MYKTFILSFVFSLLFSYFILTLFSCFQSATLDMENFLILQPYENFILDSKMLHLRNSTQI